MRDLTRTSNQYHCQGRIIEIYDTDSKPSVETKQSNDSDQNKEGQDGRTDKEEMEALAENEELIRDWLEESV